MWSSAGARPFDGGLPQFLVHNSRRTLDSRRTRQGATAEGPRVKEPLDRLDQPLTMARWLLRRHGCGRMISKGGALSNHEKSCKGRPKVQIALARAEEMLC